MPSSKKANIGLALMILISLMAVIAALITAPIEQPRDYFDFADKRTLFGIPNFFDVISNLPFFIVGLLAFKKLTHSELTINTEIKAGYAILFVGVSLVSLGSGYFHLWPTTQTLLWDRLAMTIAFMSLFSIMVAEFISTRVAKILLWPLLLVGLVSVVQWILSENAGQGDLRLYGLVQFLPLLLIPVILLCFESEFSLQNRYWWLYFCYFLAKVCEHFDDQIYALLGVVSGHSLKHLIAAFGLWILVLGYQKRVRL